ncbi:MAG: hypothetical protein Q4D50_05240 [Eubacteriales bacterium]|nr:hypothetical protein [Eubacteriales bacterium]
MKKIFAIVLTLALALSLSVTAFATEENHTITSDADGNPKPSTATTSVTFGVDPTYTITIPATVKLTKNTANGTVTYEQDATITASEGVRLLNGQTIRVTLSAGENEKTFVLNTKQGATLKYTVTVGNTEIKNGDIVATFGTSLKEQTSTLHFAAANPTFAGDYSDNVVFTISIQ